MDSESYQNRLNKAVSLLRGASRAVAFTGAGISTESGLSDFRSPGGVWDRHRVVTYQEFVSSREARIEYWGMKREFFEELKNSRPNRAHRALAELQGMGILRCVITQNIDGLHQDAGIPPEDVIELHGTNRKAVCLGCGKYWPIEELQVRVNAGDLDPACDECAGYIKPATVSFGQSMPEAELGRAFDEAMRSDLLIMIGSSLQVQPAASIPPAASKSGAGQIFINRTPTPWDHIADVIFREDAGEVMGDLIEALKEGEA